MYTQVASRLAFKGASSITDYSQPVSMDGANAAVLDMVIFNIHSASSFTARLQGSNDLQNWEDLATAPTSRTAPGYYREAVEDDVAYAYVRIKYAFTSGGGATEYCILDAGIYTFEE
jgi:hypothetical protein